MKVQSEMLNNVWHGPLAQYKSPIRRKGFAESPLSRFSLSCMYNNDIFQMFVNVDITTVFYEAKQKGSNIL